MRMPLCLRPEDQATVDVVALGENSIDLLAMLPPGPLPVGAKRRLRGLTRLPGGQAATAAAGCARLGWRTRYVGCVGDDEMGRVLVTALEHCGVEMAVATVAGATSRTAVILVEPDGERTVLEYRDPRLAFPADDGLHALVADARILIVDATDLPASIVAARFARTLGVRTIVDVDTRCDGLDSLLELADLIVVSAPFAEAYGEAGSVVNGLARLAEQFHPSLAIATLGADGAVALVNGVEIRAPGFRVAARDTTGAGDAFRAALAAGWLLHDSTADVPVLLEYANAAAALNCREIGAQAGLPIRDEVAALVTGSRASQSK
jgi:sulfofructose kinase